MQYHMAFPLSEDLKEKALNLVDLMREEEDRKQHYKSLASLVDDLLEEGSDYFFWKPLELAKVSFVGKKLVKFAINTSKKAISVAAPKLLKQMDDDQLLTIVDFMDSCFLGVEKDEV